MLAASTAELTIRMLVSLALMGLLALGSLKLFRGRLRLGPARAGIAVAHRQQLTRNASVAVVRAGHRHFLVGVTDQGVSLLAEGDDLVLEPSGPVEGAEPAGAAGAVGEGPEQNSGRGAKLRAVPTDGEPRSGAGMRHGRARGSASSGMSVIEALREKTVRRS